MAELSSPISGGLRAARTTVPSSVFGGTSASEQEATVLLRANQNSLSVISTGILGIQQRVTVLGNSLNQISSQLTQESFLEQSRIRQEQEQERRLAEQQVREGKESLVERRIQSALISPVQAIAKRTQGVLERLKGFFFTLLAGWLTNQGFEAFRAAQQGATEKLENIKNSVLTTLGVVGGIFAVMSGAFTRIIGTIAGFTKNILKFVAGAIFLKPLQALRNVISRVTGGGAKPSASSGGGSRFSMPGVGSILTGVSGVMNLVGGEYSDAAVAGLALKAPSILKPIAGATFIADEIAEMFGIRGGAGLIGKDKTQERETPTPAVKPQSNDKRENPPATPVTPSANQASSAAPIIQPQTPAIPPGPSADMAQKFQMAWDNRNNPLARGRIESAWNDMTPEQQQQAKTWAQSKGYNWNEMNLAEKTAAIQAPPKETTPVGTLPEPAPTIIAAPAPAPQMSAPSSQGSSASTNVPAISSSNPDNFYILYSQMHYNVVM